MKTFQLKTAMAIEIVYMTCIDQADSFKTVASDVTQ